jgi:Metallo-peptidase family M12B Reprolysin-like
MNTDRHTCLPAAIACLGILGSICTATTAAQAIADDPWTRAMPQDPATLAGEPWVRPQGGSVFHLDLKALRDELSQAPIEFTPQADPWFITLPMPDGTFAAYEIVESPIMAPELAAKYPEFRTYSGRGLSDPHATVRLDITPQGFHAQVLAPNGAVYIDPYTRNVDTLYAVYHKSDLQRNNEWRCLFDENAEQPRDPADPTPAPETGETLRTYRLACAATGEFTQFHGGTKAQAMGAIVTIVNRVTGIMEIDFATRLELVANNDAIVYTNSGSDPYSNNSVFAMLNQNQATCDSVIGSGNYDIGHVVSRGNGGGVAALAVICQAGSKANGVSGLFSPTGDPFSVDYVAHEMGHQFGAGHTFNSCSGSGSQAGYEPGSASTIMGYAGICGPDDLQPHSDPYFLFYSIQQIRAHVTGRANACAVKTSTGNRDPIVDAGSGYTIPKGTPFKLTAAGSDPDNDPITFCWEEADLGPVRSLSQGDNGRSPLFRSFNPTIQDSRVFPKRSALLNNTSSKGELLPTTTRALRFKVTVRDGRGGHAVDAMSLSVQSAAGPFLVTSPNTSVAWSGTQTVAWNVANTNASTVNALNVDILLSTDGGQTFPIVLEQATPNDGSQRVSLPNITTNQARIMVRATGNIFFDISNRNFSVKPSACYADCDQSTGAGVLDIFDFLCFQNSFVAGMSYACDCDTTTGPLVCDIFDFLCFQDAFVAGCP